MSEPLYLDLAGGGWISVDRSSGCVVAVSIPGLGDGSFDLLRDRIAAADADLERRKREVATEEAPDNGD